jgi:hypothetical protein
VWPLIHSCSISCLRPQIIAEMFLPLPNYFSQIDLLFPKGTKLLAGMGCFASFSACSLNEQIKHAQPWGKLVWTQQGTHSQDEPRELCLPPLVWALAVFSCELSTVLKDATAFSCVAQDSVRTCVPLLCFACVKSQFSIIFVSGSKWMRYAAHHRVQAVFQSVPRRPDRICLCHLDSEKQVLCILGCPGKPKNTYLQLCGAIVKMFSKSSL